MLRIVQLEEIQALLLQVPALVDLQQRRDPEFASAVKAWLSELESALRSNRLPAAGIVAASRSTLISAACGAIPLEVVLHGRPTRRKIRDATAALLVRQTCDLVAGTIQRDRERVADAERMMRHLVALAKAKGLIQEVPEGNQRAAMLKAIWQAMSSDAELVAGTVNVEGLLGPHDALIVLDWTLSADLSPS